MAARLPKLSLGEGPDRIFNLVAIGLAALLIIGLCGLGAWALFLRTKAPVAATPEVTAIAQLTPLATLTFTPTFTPVPALPSPTPTNTPVVKLTTPPSVAGEEEATPTPTPAETPTETPQTTPQTGLGFPILVAGLALAIFLLIIRRLRTA